MQGHVQTKFLLDDCHQHVDADGDPDLRPHSVLGSAVEAFFFSSPNLSKNALSLPLSFSCGIELAPGDKALRFVLADEIEARFKNGVLSIILPKSAQTQKQTKKIEVKVD